MQLHNGNYVRIADMLGDTPETVLRHYTALQPLESGDECDAVWEAAASGHAVVATRDLIRKVLVCLQATQGSSPQRKHQLGKVLRPDLSALRDALASLEWDRG
jgi:hypothetical protein